MMNDMTSADRKASRGIAHRGWVLRHGIVVACIASMSVLSFARDLRVLLVIGAEGTPEYGKRYAEEAGQWQEACAKAAVACEVIGLAPEVKDKPDATLLQERLQRAAAEPKRSLWLVLIGHGTFDGRDSKFNLRGPDINGTDLASWLKPMTGELAVIQTASASAPFLKALAGPDRVLISATKSADEVFYTRFGQYFAKAIGGAEEADLDRDRQVSLLEAFLWSSKQVERFFETENRLATEHALIDDNGDSSGTRAEMFDGLRLAKKPDTGKTGDGQLSRQWVLVLNDAEAKLTEETRRKRDALEREAEAIRAKKDAMKPEDYYRELDRVFTEIAKLYRPAAGGEEIRKAIQ